MKKMRRFLGVFLLIALVISSVAIIAVAASASYKGEIRDVKEMMSGVVTGRQVAIPAITFIRGTDDQTMLLSRIYEYLENTPVDPEDSEYPAFEEEYNKATFRVMYVLCENYLNAADDVSREAAFITFLKHVKNAGVLNPEDNAGLEIVVGHKCSECQAEIKLVQRGGVIISNTKDGPESIAPDVKANNIFTYDGVNSYIARPDGCSHTSSLLPVTEKYSTFEKKIKQANSNAFDVLDKMVSDLFCAADNGTLTYYEYILALETVEGILDSANALEYSEKYDKTVYSGELDVLVRKLDALNEKKSLGELKTGLADIYNYLKDTPVNPSSDEYYSKYVKYVALADALSDKYAEAVDNAPADTDAAYDISKLALLNEWRAYLTATPICESAVNAFNKKRQAVIDEYGNYELIISSLNEIEPIVPAADADAEQLRAKLDILEAAQTLDARKTAFQDVYALVTANEINPTETELIARYVTARDSLRDELITAVNGESSVSGKIAALKELRNYLAETPVSKNTVDRYNSARREIIESCEKLISEVSKEGFIPSYTAPKTYAVTVNEAALFGMLETFENSLQAYESAETVQKLAALETAKSAAKDMYVYLKASTPDVSADYYADFLARYSSSRTELVRAMISAAETAGGEDAFKSVRDWLNAYPLTKALVDEYNAKVDEVFAENESLKTSLKASCVYHKIDLIAEEIESPESIDLLYGNIKLLSGYYNAKLDVTDEAYEIFKNTLYTAAEISFIDAVRTHVNTAESPLEALEYLTELSEFVKDIYLSSASIEEIRDGIFGTAVSEHESYRAELDSSSITSEYEEILELIYSFNNIDKSDYDARKTAFEAIYDKICSADTTVITGTDSDYAALMKIYAAACSEMESAIFAYVDSFGAVAEKLAAMGTERQYIDRVKFSDSVVESFNTKLRAMDIGYAEEKVKVEAVEIFAYTPIASVDFDALEDCLAGTVDKNGLSDAYHIIANAKFDFGSEQYAEVLKKFNDAKLSVMNTFKSELDAASDKAAKILEIEAWFLEDPNDENDRPNVFSASMVNFYNGTVINAFKTDAVKDVIAKHKILESVAERIDDYVDAVDSNALTVSQKTRYQTVINTYLTAIRYAYIRGEILYIDNVCIKTDIYKGGKEEEVDVSLVYKNQELDALTYFMSKNIEGNSIYRGFTDRAFASVLYTDAFIKLLNEIDKLTGQERQDEIAAFEQYAADNCIPAELISLFNSRFGTAYTATAPARTTAKGDMLSFLAKLDSFNEKSSLSEMKDGFAATTQYLNASPIPQSKPYDTYYADAESSELEGDAVNPITELKLSLFNQTEAQKELLESKVPATQYDLGYELDTKGSLAATNKISGKFKYDGSKAYAYKMSAVAGSPQIIESNGYVTMYSGNGTEYFDLWAENDNSVVFEFDIMIPENNGGKQAVMFSSQSVYFWIEDYTLTYNKDFNPKEDYFELPKGDLAVKFTPGEWRHITFVVNVEDGTRELHVDYVPIAKIDRPLDYDANIKSVYARETHFIRFQNMIQYPTSIYDNGYCYDNISVYDGNMYRNPEGLESMPEAAQFQTYVEFFEDETCAPQDRLFAYYKARELYSAVKDNPTVAKYVTVYESFDYVNEIEVPARKYYMDKIEADLAAIESVTITTATAADQQKKIQKLQNYINENFLYLDSKSERLLEINNSLASYQHQVSLTSYVDDLAISISQFFRAPTLVALNKHYANIEKYIELTELREEGNEERIMKDPAIKAVFIPIKINKTVKALMEGKTLNVTLFCEAYVPWRLADQTRIENSLKIVDCMGFIESIVDDDTLSGSAYETALVNKAVEEENYDFVESYMAVIRRIRSSGEYTSNADAERALRLADLIDAQFYVKLQVKHIGVLKEYIERYSLTNSYIERLGICLYLENYMADNDIDYTNPEAKLYKETLVTYQNEVNQYLVDYEKLLESNTIAFVGIVNEMDTYTSYSKIKPLYDKALTTYYYAMNTDSAEAKAAVVRFNEYAEWLTALEENSAMLVGYSKNLTSKRQAQKYRALVNSMSCIEAGVDEGIDGVKAALESYNKALAEYNESIGAANGEISEVTDVVSAVRSNSIASTVLAIIKRIFN